MADLNLIKWAIWTQEAEKHRLQGNNAEFIRHTKKAEYAWQEYLASRGIIGRKT